MVSNPPINCPRVINNRVKNGVKFANKLSTSSKKRVKILSNPPINCPRVIKKGRKNLLTPNGLRLGDGGAFEKRQPNICTNAQ
jgi:hypothetical protein